MNLNELSLKELKQLQQDVSKAISSYELRHKQAALLELEAKAKEFGFALDELFSIAPMRKKRQAAKAKYRHPENAELTWSGRGRKPKWISDALEAGKELSDLAL